MPKTAAANMTVQISLALFVAVLAAFFLSQNLSAYISNVEQEIVALQEGQLDIIGF